MSQPVWTVVGQSGHALNNTSRTAGAMGMLGGVLTLASLDVDTLIWRQVSGTIPDNQQAISLYRDGVCVFQGLITQRKVIHDATGGANGKYYSFIASGALWAMSKAQITGSFADDSSTSATRTIYVLPQQDLRTSVMQILTLAPGIDPGTVDTMFNVGQKTFTNGTWLSVLVEVLKPCADVATWVDYTVTPPQLNVARRGGMTTLAITIGTSAVSRVEMTPRTELQVSGISLAYSSRRYDGKMLYGSQNAGDASHIVTVSGPEVGGFVPPDNLPQMTVQTVAVTGNDAEAWAMDTTLAQAVAKYGDFPYGYSRGNFTSAFSDYPHLTAPSGYYRLTAGSVTDFMKSDYGVEETALHLTGWIFISYFTSSGYGTLGTYLVSTGKALSWVDYSSGTHYSVLAIKADYTVNAINQSWPSMETLYQAKAWEYLTAPSGMAAGMYAAANFVPYEGQIDLNPAFAWGRYLATKVNIAGSDADLATAGAIVQGVTIPLDPGVISLRLGAPQRVSLMSTVGRYQASTKDNIYINF